MSAPLLRTKSQLDVLRIIGTPGSHLDLIQEGPFATVARTWTTIEEGVPQWVVVKSATTLRKFSREPHDIIKELRLLSSMTHPNIASVIASARDDEQHMLSIYMPYFPLSLASLLASPYLSPHFFPPDPVPDPKLSALHEEQFIIIAKSIMIQALSALAFLHDEQRRIGHRDIKPENILLTTDGCVKLIDFGVSWNQTEPDTDKTHDLWPEYKGKLYFEVSTRAYRAPELLFGTRNYDQCAVDLWSIGATFAEFFTALRMVSDDEDDGDDDDDTEDDADTEPIVSFIVPKYLRIGYPGAQWRRDTLFNGERGEIGLAWSIFKTFGTPTKENWPDFEELPGAMSVVFNVVPSTPLLPLLPNLPPSSLFSVKDVLPVEKCLERNASNIKTTNIPPSSTSSTSSLSLSDFPEASTISLLPSSPSSSSSSSSSNSPTPLPPSASLPTSKPTTAATTSFTPRPIDLLTQFLTYPSSSRLRAEDAMRHPWFTQPGSVLLLPKGYCFDRNQGWLEEFERSEWEGKTLGDLLGSVLVGGAAGAGAGAGAGGNGVAH